MNAIAIEKQANVNFSQERGLLRFITAGSPTAHREAETAKAHRG